MPEFRVACVQMRSGLDRIRNIDDAIAGIRKAAAGEAQFIATPEMTNIVDRKASRFFDQLPDETRMEEIPAFAEAAKDARAWLLIGSMAVRVGDNRAANRSYLFSPAGETVATYDKIHRFDVSLPHGETWRESAIYDAGDKAVLADIGSAKLGLSICYDLRFPSLYRQLAQAGANILCVPAAFTRQTGQAHWEILLRARAIENGAFVIAPAQGGLHEDGRETFGHSMVVDPWGKTLATLNHDDTGVIFATIDPSRAVQARERIPNLALEQSIELTSYGS